jgi:hypothetical protein
MKKLNYIICAAMLMWLPARLHAQDASNKGNTNASGQTGSLTVSKGANMIISGDAKLVLQDASFINNGTLQAGSSTFIFTDVSKSPSLIAGNAPTNFHHLIIDKSNSLLQLENDIAVLGVLQLQAGNLELNRHNIDLGQSGTIAGEHANARITGINGGTITIMARLNAPRNANPGNIGAMVSANADLGPTFITRGHVQQINADGQTSINRYYDIRPAYGSGAKIDLRFQYLAPELGKNNSGELVMWSGTGTQWTSAENTGSGENWILKNNLQSANRFTLGVGANTKSAIARAGNTQIRFGAQAVQTYPNPAYDKFTLAVTSQRNMQGYIMLQDEFGRVLEKRSVTYRTGVNTMEWNLGKYASGNYYLVFDSAWENVKIIKQ